MLLLPSRKLHLPRRQVEIREPSKQKVRGEVFVYLDDVLVQHVSNLWISNGYARTTQWLVSNTLNGGAAIAPPCQIAVGTSSTLPASADTALGFEVYREAISSASTLSAYSARLVAVFPGPAANFTLREAGLFDVATDQGTSSGSNTASSLNDSTKAWTVNAWAGYKVNISSGTGSGESATIVSNTATQLVISGTWTTTPDNTSTYAIAGGQMFAHAAVTVVKTSSQILNVTWQINEPTS